MGISDKIEAFICELIKEDDGWVELGRNELAGIFGCVPSQINYVMRTRFTPEKGYVIESRRGGGGYLKIRRVAVDFDDIIGIMPDSLTKAGAAKIVKLAHDSGILNTQATQVALGAVQCDEINDEQRRAVLKSMLCEIMKGE